jgi:hypothetical protein
MMVLKNGHTTQKKPILHSQVSKTDLQVTVRLASNLMRKESLGKR